MRPAIAVVFCIVSAAAFSRDPTASLLNGTWQADPYVLEVSLSYGVLECSFCHPYVRVRADGHDYSIPRTGFDTVRATEIDGRTVSLVGKLGRDPVFLIQMTASADGKTLLVQQRIARPGEKPVESSMTVTRVGAGSPKSHPISGRWSKPIEEDFTSFQIVGDTIVRKNSQGSSYSANLDGTDAPYYGRPGVSVSVKLIDDRTLMQTDKKDGQIFLVEHLTVDADSQTIRILYEYPGGSVVEQTAHRVAQTSIRGGVGR